MLVAGGHPQASEDSQAAAAVGQRPLARAWSGSLSAHKLTAGQVLVTFGDTARAPLHGLNARSTIAKLLEWRSVPVINENDTVATSEIRYGDNDRLAARVATMMSADLLVLLSDVDGLYDKPPNLDDKSAGGATLVPLVAPHYAGDRGDGGRVGLGSLARRHADQDRGPARSPPPPARNMIIASGHVRHPLKRTPTAASAPGFDAGQSGDRAQEVDRRFRSEPPRGALVTGRRRGPHALRSGKSLLPAGVVKVEGAFGRGDAVVVRGPDGAEIGRGLIAFDADDAERIKGRSSADIPAILGFSGRTEMIHRDDLVLGGE